MIFLYWLFLQVKDEEYFGIDKEFGVIVVLLCVLKFDIEIEIRKKLVLFLDIVRVKDEGDCGLIIVKVSMIIYFFDVFICFFVEKYIFMFLQSFKELMMYWLRVELFI